MPGNHTGHRAGQSGLVAGAAGQLGRVAGPAQHLGDGTDYLVSHCNYTGWWYGGGTDGSMATGTEQTPDY